MWTIIFYGLTAALLALMFMYLDTKLLDNPKTKTTYIKGMLMTGAVTVIILNFYESVGGGETTQFLPGLSEEIITGPPQF